jgi:Ca-activated chloride channel family protein
VIERSATVALLACLALAGEARASVGTSMRRGLALEREKKYDEAIKAYQEALVLEPDNVRIHYDLARALYERQQLPEAADHFQLGALTRSRTLRARTLYNLGDTEYRQHQLDRAIAAYTLALVQQPDDAEAKQNLEYCLKIKAEQKQQPDSTRKQQPNPQSQPQPQQEQPPKQEPAQGGKGAIGKDQADRMLQALQSKERENLKKQPKKPQEQKPGGKDW